METVCQCCCGLHGLICSLSNLVDVSNRNIETQLWGRRTCGINFTTESPQHTNLSHVHTSVFISEIGARRRGDTTRSTNCPKVVLSVIKTSLIGFMTSAISASSKRGMLSLPYFSCIRHVIKKFCCELEASPTAKREFSLPPCLAFPEKQRFQLGLLSCGRLSLLSNIHHPCQ